MARTAERKYRGVALSERQDERRKRLLAAAFAVYARVGYSGATVRLVCGEAGLTARYFYESFSDPIALLSAAFEAALQGLEEILRAALAEAPPDPDSRRQAVLTAYYGRLREDAGVANIFLSEMHGVSAEIDAKFRRALRGFGLSLAEIAPAIATAPALFADGLAGGLNQIALGWIDDDYKQPIEEVVAAATLLFAGVR